MKLLPTLTKDTANFNFEWAGEDVQFSIYRHSLTLEVFGELKNADNDPKGMARTLTTIIADWNIEDVDCKDADAIAKSIPMEFMKLLMEKAGSLWSGDAKKPVALASGSAA
jgi:hypothetical protein